MPAGNAAANYWLAALRSDLDRLVTQVLIPGRERGEPGAAAALWVEWETLKEKRK